MAQTLQPELAIVGGGILGVTTALLASLAGYEVRVFVSPGPEPKSDSQRNHGWHQSGLLYETNVVSGRVMHNSGIELHDLVGFRPPSERGVFRFATPEGRESFLQHARNIKLLNQVEELSDSQARDRLRDFFLKDHYNFLVPDAPFDEMGIMEEIRTRSIENSAIFETGHAQFERNSKAQNGFDLFVNNKKIEAEAVVVCAGGGTKQILSDLALKDRVKVERSALLVFDYSDGIHVPLLADRARGLSVVRWFPTRAMPTGSIVVGGDGRHTLDEEDLVDLSKREVTVMEKEALIAMLPKRWLNRAPKPRATAGYKTEFIGKTKHRTAVDPWVESFDEYPCLTIALPGKATLAMHTAKQILRTVEAKLQKDQSQLKTNVEHGDSDWTDPIRAHWELTDLDESEDK